MDLANIEVFLAIARTRSISKAAKTLFVSQSTVSYRLKLLEEELDCKLIERGRGQNQSLLTKEGETFFPIAERLKNIQYDIVSFKEVSRHPVISIGCVESMGLYLLDELYNDVIRRGNRVKMHFLLNNNERLFDMVEGGQLDIAYVMEPLRQKSMSLTPFFAEQMILAASPELSFPGNSVHPSQLDIRDACQFDWKEQGLNLWYEHWFNPKELPYLKTNSPPLAFSFMKKHECWAIVPHSMGTRLEKEAGMKLYTLKESPPERICYRVTSKTNHQLYPEVIQYWDREVSRFIRSKPWLTMAAEEKDEGD